MVVGLLVAVVSFGGGLSVSAEELEPRMDHRRDSYTTPRTIHDEVDPKDGI